MIELNLIPDELKIKKRKAFELAKLPLIQVASGIFFLIVISHIVLIVFTNMNKLALSGLKKEWNNLDSERKQIDGLKTDAKLINERVKAIQELTQKRILWAKKLNLLSDLMPMNIWLESALFNKKTASPKLILEGFSKADSTEEGAANVARFIQLLKESAEFFDGLEDIELGSIKRAVIEKQEVMNFKIICSFKK